MDSSRDALSKINLSLCVDFKELMDGVDVWLRGLGFVSRGEGDVDRVAGDLSKLLVHRY